MDPHPPPQTHHADTKHKAPEGASFTIKPAYPGLHFPIPPAFSRTSSHSSVRWGGQGVSIFRPIVYGNTAHPVNASSRPRGMPVDHTHLWTISLRGVDNADITHFIKKVQFKLHADTYANPTRSTHTSPFLPCCCLVSPSVHAC